MTDRFPTDLEPLLEFVPLLREFYIKGGLRELIPKYIAIGEAYATEYRNPVGNVIYDVLDYFHTRPETVINMRPLVVTTGETDGKRQKETVITRTRTQASVCDPRSAGPARYVDRSRRHIESEG